MWEHDGDLNLNKAIWWWLNTMMSQEKIAMTIDATDDVENRNQFLVE